LEFDLSAREYEYVLEPVVSALREKIPPI